MALKRPREDDTARPSKKQRKGFAVGPANLPDGTYKRKVQKIKKGLIDKAKLKKQYAKLKAREEAVARRSVYDGEDVVAEPPEPVHAPNLEPHPDRLKMLEESSQEPGPQPPTTHSAARTRKRPRPQPFQKEAQLAQKRKQEAETRRIAHEVAVKERAKKLAERERHRKVMAKASSGGPKGQKKLGRQSTVLLERARRLLGTT